MAAGLKRWVEAVLELVSSVPLATAKVEHWSDFIPVSLLVSLTKEGI
jgi:hypothetical protein